MAKSDVTSVERLADFIHDVPDWPTPGVVFKDITPLLADAEALRFAIEQIAGRAPTDIDVVVGVEARGFIIGAPVAVALGTGFVPVRKPGKLPRPTVGQAFALEYGIDALHMHTDALRPGTRVLVVDDVLATGGTIETTTRLVGALGAHLVGVAVLLELAFLGGRQRLTEAGIPVAAVLTATA